MECSVEGCDRKRTAKGMCPKHYARHRRLGTTDLATPFVVVEPGEDYDACALRRLATYSAEGPAFKDLGPCRDWARPLRKDGYSGVRYRGKIRLGHDLAWELANGPVPEGLELDHLCRRRHCIRVIHLEPVTRKVNWERGDGPAVWAQERERIVRGADGRFRLIQ